MRTLKKKRRELSGVSRASTLKRPHFRFCSQTLSSAAPCPEDDTWLGIHMAMGLTSEPPVRAQNWKGLSIQQQIPIVVLFFFFFLLSI